ncbi:hypothetical protein EV192_103675 [Actinocrispum wychmicini]|uniref:Uncharacterized protein n=1 Tax=Actinocrispum wychmicini TaxID=1213861 RepID=A0A4R2JM07_9PSEU|nr:hypothetical protein EV192_103675 [Actinocrispum wychmicini]
MAAGLLRVTDPAQSRYQRGALAWTVTTAPQARDWERAEPAARWRCLLRAWRELTQFPLATDDPHGPEGDQQHPAAPLQERPAVTQAPMARRVLLDAVAAPPAGTGFDVTAAAGVLQWHCPRLFLDPAGDRVDRLHGWRLDADVAGPAVLAETALLGITADDGVVTPVGRALAASDPAELAEALLPVARRVRVQADYTVIATGLPTVEVDTLLDSCARPETDGFARTWRIVGGRAGPSWIRRLIQPRGGLLAGACAPNTNGNRTGTGTWFSEYTCSTLSKVSLGNTHGGSPQTSTMSLLRG